MYCRYLQYFLSLVDSESRTALPAAPYSVPFGLFPGNVIVNAYNSVSDCMGKVADDTSAAAIVIQPQTTMKSTPERRTGSLSHRQPLGLHRRPL
jgi:hypothetical protein